MVGRADQTGLPSGSASVVIGEAMLSMQTAEHKRLIAAEAFRLLRPGGRYGIHELAVVPEDMSTDRQREIDRALSSVIHVGARPLPAREWKLLLESVGFRVVAIGYAPMHLLRPLRLIQDEGILGTLRLAKNLMVDNAARRRVLAMRLVFERYRRNLSAIYIVAQKELDEDDFVTGASRAARQILGLSQACLQKSLPVAEVPGLSERVAEDLAMAERGVLQRALARAEGNVKAAAETLGMSRATLYRKLRRLDLHRSR